MSAGRGACHHRCMLSRTVVAVAAVTTAATGCAAATALVVGGERLTGRGPVVELLVILAVGWSFAGCGLTGWARRPASRTGPLMMVAGLVWFLRAVAAFPGPVPHRLGQVAGVLFAGVLAVLVAGYPEGRPRAHELARRWWASAPRRRVQAPATVGAATVLAATGARVLGERLDWPPMVLVPVGWLPDLALVLWPPALLLGILRDRFDRAAIGALVLTLSHDAPGPGRVRDALARALRDESLEVAFPLPGGGQIDAAGRPARLAGAAGRVVTVLERDGEPIATLRYDAAADPGLVREAGAAAGLALQNERLRAEALARLDEVRRSRTRILAAADAARRNVERDLHDGAQQRLIGAALALRLVIGRVDGPVADDLAIIAAELDAAVRELRELARGLHPTVLTDGGLGPALTSLAERSPVPVILDVVPGHRLPEAVEVACYFIVAEALTNAAKHAGAQVVWVTVNETREGVRVKVADDGRGGADPAGSGLSGLADRVAALGGSFHVRSDENGTRIIAELPCG